MSRSTVPFRLLLPVLIALCLGLGQQPAQAKKPAVELYVTSWCPYCKKAAAYFRARGVPFTTYNIEQNATALARFQRYGVQGVPLAVINGLPIAGYAVGEYDRALAGK